MIRLTLPWSALASSNERHKARGGKAHSDRYVASLDAIHLKAVDQLRALKMRLPVFPSGAVFIRFKFYPPDRRIRDELNYTKGIADALKRVAYADDSQVTEWHGSRHAVDAANPRVELTITPVAENAP